MEITNVEIAKVSNDIRIINPSSTLQDVRLLREKQFKKYPNGGDTIDKFDLNSFILTGYNSKETLTSTGRIVFDSSFGLPADKYAKKEIDKLREENLVIAELSKFAIAPEAKGMLRSYLKAYYEIAVSLGIDSYVSINPSKDVNIYKKIYAARVLVKDIGHSYGTNNTFSMMEYKIKEVKPCLAAWLGEELS